MLGNDASASVRQIPVEFLLLSFYFRSLYNLFIWGKRWRMWRRRGAGAAGCKAWWCPVDPRRDEPGFPPCSRSTARSSIPLGEGKWFLQDLCKSLLARLPAVVRKVGHLVLQGYERIKGVCDAWGARGGRMGVGSLALMITPAKINLSPLFRECLGLESAWCCWNNAALLESP